jgi:class 3 adenylate cyclase
MNAYEEAVRHLERALTIWDRVATPDQIAGTGRIELMLRASQLAEWAGDPERALALGEQARHDVDEQAASLLAATAETRIGRALWMAGRGDDAIAHLAEARRLVPSHPPSVQLAEALAEEGRALMLAGQSRQARGRLEEALELATALAAPHVEASALNSLAVVYALAGDMERGIASGRRGLAVATEFGLGVEVHRAYVNGSQALDDAGRMQEALEMGLEGIEDARRTGFDRAAGDQLRVQAAWRLARMGRFAEAEAVIKPALEAATTPFNIAASKAIAGRLAAERGEFEVAGRLLSEAWALMQRSGGFQLIGPTQAWMVSLHLWRGELAEAKRRVAEGFERVRGAEPDLIYNGELFWLGVRVHADLVAELDASGAPDQREGAEASGREVIAELDEAINETPGGAPPEAVGFRVLAEAELSRLRGQHDPAPWRAAGEHFQALEARYLVAYTQLRAAEALCVAGTAGGAHAVSRPGAARAEAEALLAAAHAAAVAMGTRPLQEMVEDIARAHGISLATRSTPPVGDVLELLVGNRHGPRPDRLLATVMFTDIVGSTALAAKLGDREWRAVLDQHDDLVRRTVSEFGGVVIQFVGDGTLSTFDSPGRAIACACALRDRVKTLGLEIRAGVHTGEIELRGPDIGGIAVHIGARVAAFAGPSEILVSQTVADAVTGSGTQFEDRGAHDLKGVPGSWNLSAVVSVGDPVGPA